MDIEDFVVAGFCNAVIWGGAYKVSVEAGSDFYLIAGWVMSALVTMYYMRRARYRSAFMLISNDVIESELRKRAAEASEAINTSAELRRQCNLGYDKYQEFRTAKARMEMAIHSFEALQQAAISIGHAEVRASIKDYLS